MLDFLHKKIVVNPESINSLNDFEHTPVDLALMLNNVRAVKLLFGNGAIENPKRNLINFFPKKNISA